MVIFFHSYVNVYQRVVQVFGGKLPTASSCFLSSYCRIESCASPSTACLFMRDVNTMFFHVFSGGMKKRVLFVHTNRVILQLIGSVLINVGGIQHSRLAGKKDAVSRIFTFFSFHFRHSSFFVA